MRTDTASPYSAYKKLFSETPRPFAWLNADALRHNMASVRARAGSLPIRIASKSIRSVPVLRLLLEEGENFRGLMTFSPDETLWLSSLGFDDLLIGYPFMDESRAIALCQEIRKGKRIVFMVDSLPHLELLSKAGKAAQVDVPVCLDLDMSSDFPGIHFGVYRSPLNTAQAAEQFYRQLKSFGNLRLVGLMGYEAQIAGVGDNVKGRALMNAVIRLLKKRSLKEVLSRRMQAVAVLKQLGAPLEFVNGGGSGSLEDTRSDASVTELTVGSAFYSPTLFDAYTGFKHEPAAGFCLEIVRQPQPGIYTCQGGGYIASGSAGPEKLPSVFLPEGASLEKNEGAGEVQTPVRYSGPESLSTGDPVFFRHAKAGELCERFDALLTFSEGKRMEKFLTYRGEGKCFI